MSRNLEISLIVKYALSITRITFISSAVPSGSGAFLLLSVVHLSVRIEGGGGGGQKGQIWPFCTQRLFAQKLSCNFFLFCHIAFPRRLLMNRQKKDLIESL